MADYLSCTTTNYFQVTSKEELENLVSRIDCDDEIEISSSPENGKTYYKLCAYGSFYGIDASEDTKELYKEFQKILPDGEVLAIFEVGHEKLRYVAGSTVVITNETYQVETLQNIATKIAKTITSNSCFELNL